MGSRGISKFVWPGGYVFITLVGLGGVWFWGIVLYFLLKWIF